MRCSPEDPCGGEGHDRPPSCGRGPTPPGAAWRLLLGGLLLLGAACSGKGPKIPSPSPSDAAGQALAEYDANKDGALDAKELEQCPALKDARKRGMDKNNDGRLTADEIKDRLSIFQSEGMLGSLLVEVRFDGHPLGSATVTLTPERFLGPSFKPATGTTDASGSAILQVEGLEKGVVPYGYYRVEVSKKSAGGKELVPARYNTKTTLGHEVAPARALDRRGEDDTLRLALTSK